jgi:predicted secreted Zn-dependent protease
MRRMKNTIRNLLPVFFSTWIFLSAAAYAEPEIHETFDYYSIYPSRVSDLGRALDAATTIHEDGRTYRGHTHWHVNWHFWWDQRDGNCTINRVQASVDIQYVMPQLSSSVDARTSAAFRKYDDALLLHEKGHAQHGIQAAREIEEKLLGISSNISCQVTESLANDAGKQIVQKYSAEDVVYDRETDHGRTQGAVLP